MKKITVYFYLWAIISCVLPLTCHAASDKTKNIIDLPQESFPYSFKHEPFVNPRIVQDLTGSSIDSDDQVVAINLLASQDSNRYYGDVHVKEIEGGNSLVSSGD